MISLYYTGSDSYLKEQKNPNQSLGGFVSKSLVPSNLLEAFFSDISNFSIQNDLTEIKMFALKNETLNTIEDIMMYIVPKENSISKVSFSVIQPNSQNCGTGCEYYFEKISSIRDMPVHSQNFYDCTSFKPSNRIELATPASLGEVITLLGVNTSAASKDLTIDETYKLIEKAFRNNIDYTVSFINYKQKTYNDNADEYFVDVKYLQIIKENDLNDTSAITFSTTGTTTLKESKSFAGGEDNSILIGSLEAGKYLGIWVKREIDVDKFHELNGECVDMSQKTPIDNSESMELFFTY